MKKVICLVGPTAIGKTSLSIELSKKFNMEIISGDSVQVYRHLDIGSGKIKKEEMDGVIHHLIDIKEPSEDYSVSEFQKEGRKLIDEISLNSKIPFVVGGTGFYIKALLYNYEFINDSRTDEFYDLTNEEIYNKLKELNDPSIPDLNNRKRLLRHLEIISKGDMPNKKDEPLYDFLIIGLTAPREIIYERINKRVDQMVNDGLIKEVESLKKYNLSNGPRLAIGYKEIFDYLDGITSVDESIELVKQHSRNFAKRQLTYFNNQFNIHWIDITKDEPLLKAIEIVEDFLNE